MLELAGSVLVVAVVVGPPLVDVVVAPGASVVPVKAAPQTDGSESHAAAAQFLPRKFTFRFLLMTQRTQKRAPVPNWICALTVGWSTSSRSENATPERRLICSLPFFSSAEFFVALLLYFQVVFFFVHPAPGASVTQRSSVAP